MKTPSSIDSVYYIEYKKKTNKLKLQLWLPIYWLFFQLEDKIKRRFYSAFGKKGKKKNIYIKLKIMYNWNNNYSV